MSELPYIAMYQLPDHMPEGTTAMLEGDIEGTRPLHHQVDAGRVLKLPADPGRQSVLFFIDGEAVCEQGEYRFSIKEKGAVIPDPQKTFMIRAKKAVSVLEISWELTASDREQLKKNLPSYPIIQLYSSCPHYTEPFKSVRTISRTIVRHNILPRFSMGSNEADGEDRVELNSHPAIDQYFFSFPENDMELLIEDGSIHFGGSTLLHVPLGCRHGARIGKGQKMHYIWIDFMVDEKQGLEYLDTVHQPISE